MFGLFRLTFVYISVVLGASSHHITWGFSSFLVYFALLFCFVLFLSFFTFVGWVDLLLVCLGFDFCDLEGVYFSY